MPTSRKYNNKVHLKIGLLALHRTRVYTWYLCYEVVQLFGCKPAVASTACILRVLDHNGISHLYNMLGMYHSGPEPLDFV